MPDFAIQWKWAEIASDYFIEKSRWLGEPRRLGSGCEYFFGMAAKLLTLAHQDFTLVSPAFFHAIIGLERALRVHYKPANEIYGSLCEGNKDRFCDLFQKAVDDGVITDSLFETFKPLPNYLLEMLEASPASHSETLAKLIPKLRNQYFHGRNSFLAADLFFLAIQLREIADRLKTRGEKSLIE